MLLFGGLKFHTQPFASKVLLAKCIGLAVFVRGAHVSDIVFIVFAGAGSIGNCFAALQRATHFDGNFYHELCGLFQRSGNAYGALQNELL